MPDPRSTEYDAEFQARRQDRETEAARHRNDARRHDTDLGHTHMREAERKLLEVAQRLYPSRPERCAMRGALMDAAGLLDALATDIGKEHTTRGRITNRGMELTALVTRCANAVFAMRQKIGFPDEGDEITAPGWRRLPVNFSIQISDSGLVALDVDQPRNLSVTSVTGLSLQKAFEALIIFAEDCARLGRPFEVLQGVKLR